jgi:hypothetical protein
VGWKEIITKVYKETFGHHKCVHCLDCGKDIMSIYKCQNTKFYTLNMYSILCADYISIKFNFYD